MSLDDRAALAAWAMGVAATRIDHVDRQFTLPLGAQVEIDAAAGTIRVLAPAVR
jgi:muramoyltetrapeptide carboxypeptidase LdcA involved in peptidoglycan recycling